MKRMLILLLFLIICALVVHADESRLSLVRTFPKEDSKIENDYLIHPYELKVWKEFYIVADAVDNCLKVFKKDGTFERKIGRPGQGPGELNTAFRISLDGERGLIYVADSQNGRISSFCISGEPSSMIKTFMPPLNVQYIDGNLHICGYNPSLGSLFSIYSSSGTLLKRYGELFDNKIPLTKSTPYLYENLVFNAIKDNIYVLFEFIPYILVYSNEGILLNKITIADDRVQGSFKNNIEALKKGPINGNLKVFPWNNGGCVDDNRVYYLSNFRNSNEKILVLSLDGLHIRDIPFEADGDYGAYRLVAINKGEFIFVDWSEGEIKVYRERHNDS